MNNTVTPINKGASGFQLQPADVNQAMQMADMLAKSQMVPKHYQGKPQDTLVAMMMGSELGLNPIQSLQHIAVINGKPSVYGDALLALVQNHPSFGGIDESFDKSTQTASCTVWRKGGQKHTQTFSKADAEKAGLWGKSGPWQTYPKRMLQMRARGFAVRDQFADALAGLITAEEAEDYPQPAERDVTPRQPQKAALSEYVTDDQVQAIRDAAQTAGISEANLCAKGKVSSLDQLQASRYQPLMNYLAQQQGGEQ